MALAVAVVALLVGLMSRAYANPRDDADDDLRDAVNGDSREDVLRSERRDWNHDDAAIDGGRGIRARVYVPLDAAIVERVVTFAPPVAAVVSAAYRAAGIADTPATSWRRRSRIAALVPSMSFRAGQNEAWRDISDPTVSHSVVFDVRASWRLDRLLFDGNELRIDTLDVARRRERRRLAALTIRVYFDWVAARAAVERDGRALLDLAEKTAELDALTDGWFSEAVRKGAELR